MKLSVMILAIATSMACGSEPWNPPTGGVIGRLFPKHPQIHIESPGSEVNRRSYLRVEQIGIERTACYGKCPIYSLIVNRDGTFRYFGGAFVKRRGAWHGSVNTVELADVLGYAAEMNYFDLADLYGDETCDVPGVFTLVKTSTRQKAIYDYAGVGPARLKALENMIDRLLERAKWKRD